eukprot:2215436-Heterocapsa_arctica.AAC.1
MIAGWSEFFQELNSLPHLYIPALVDNVINHSVSSGTSGAGREAGPSQRRGTEGRQGEGTGSGT